MLELLTNACYRGFEEQEEFNMHHPSGLELWPQLPEEWEEKPYRELLVYVPAHQTIDRNAGLRVFARFAKAAIEHGVARNEANPGS